MADWEPRPPHTATLAEHNIEFAEFMRLNNRVTTLRPDPPTLPPTPKAPIKSKPAQVSDYIYFSVAGMNTIRVIRDTEETPV